MMTLTFMINIMPAQFSGIMKRIHKILRHFAQISVSGIMGCKVDERSDFVYGLLRQAQDTRYRVGLTKNFNVARSSCCFAQLF